MLLSLLALVLLLLLPQQFAEANLIGGPDVLPPQLSVAEHLCLTEKQLATFTVKCVPNADQKPPECSDQAYQNLIENKKAKKCDDF